MVAALEPNGQVRVETRGSTPQARGGTLEAYAARWSGDLAAAARTTAESLVVSDDFDHLAQALASAPYDRFCRTAEESAQDDKEEAKHMRASRQFVTRQIFAALIALPQFGSLLERQAKAAHAAHSSAIARLIRAPGALERHQEVWHEDWAEFWGTVIYWLFESLAAGSDLPMWNDDLTRAQRPIAWDPLERTFANMVRLHCLGQFSGLREHFLPNALIWSPAGRLLKQQGWAQVVKIPAVTVECRRPAESLSATQQASSQKKLPSHTFPAWTEPSCGNPECQDRSRWKLEMRRFLLHPDYVAKQRGFQIAICGKCLAPVDGARCVNHPDHETTELTTGPSNDDPDLQIDDDEEWTPDPKGIASIEQFFVEVRDELLKVLRGHAFTNRVKAKSGYHLLVLLTIAELPESIAFDEHPPFSNDWGNAFALRLFRRAQRQNDEVVIANGKWLPELQAIVIAGRGALPSLKPITLDNYKNKKSHLKQQLLGRFDRLVDESC